VHFALLSLPLLLLLNTPNQFLLKQCAVFNWNYFFAHMLYFSVGLHESVNYPQMVLRLRV
jgi:hypothetical protein